MQRLHRFLIDYDIAMLRTLAQNRGVALTTNRKVEAAAQLSAALLDELSVRSALARLSVGGQEALEALVAAGGRMRGPQFARRFGPVRPIGPGRLEREAPWQEPANPHEELYYLGLVFHAFYDDGGGPGEFVFIPGDLLPLLPGTQAEVPSFSVEVVPVPVRREAESQSLVEDMFVYLVYLQTHDVRPYADGRLGRRDLAALHTRIPDPRERRLRLVRHLAARLGFVVLKEGLLRLETRPVKEWLTAPAVHQLRVLQEGWHEDPAWNDLCRVPGLECDQATPWQNDPLATRRAVLALLARCPVDAWWTLGSFVAAVKAYHPDFQRPDGDYTSWYIRDASSGDYLSGFASWENVEGVLLADLLTGPLCWLGVIATAHPGGSGPACRLTRAGARFVGLVAEEPTAGPSPPIVVHPDFSIEAPAPADRYVRFQLERFAQPESADGHRYRLTVDSLGRALARGVRIDQVLAFLRQESGDSVPGNVAGQLQTWAGRFGQVLLEEMALLRVKSERVLKELSVLPETRDLIGQVLSPTSALVPRRNLARLRRALGALGFLPAEESPRSDQAKDD
jgi:hypothetical protein